MSEKLALARVLEYLLEQRYTGEVRLQLNQGRPTIVELPTAPKRIPLDSQEKLSAH